MRLHVLLAGAPDMAPLSIVVQPGDNVTTMLERVLVQLPRRPRDNIPGVAQGPIPLSAYRALLHGQWPLVPDAPDRVALQKGDPAVVDRYTSREAWLDPKRPVADYLADVPDDAIAIVLTRPEDTRVKQPAVRASITPWSMVEECECRVQQELEKDKDWFEKIKFEPTVQDDDPVVVPGGQQLDVLVTGVRGLVVSVAVRPDDTIAKVYDIVITKALAQIRKRIPAFRGIFNFTLYSAQHRGDWPLRRGGTDHIALETNYDADITTRYFAPSLALDETKTVAESFVGPVPLDALAIVLCWVPASAEKYLVIRAQLDKPEMLPQDEADGARRRLQDKTRLSPEVELPRERHRNAGSIALLGRVWGMFGMSNAVAPKKCN